MLRFLSIVVTLLTLTLSLAADCSAAQNCDDIKQGIKKQRNLLKKKVLLDQGLQNCSEDAEIYYLYAYTAERLRKYDQAMSYYLKATELDQDYAKAFFGLGDIYMVLGNAGAAIRAFEKGLQFVPENRRAKASLDLARIKHKSESGEAITSAEFIRVMQESKKEETTSGALDGPILRLQIRFHIDSAQLTEKAEKQLSTVGRALESSALEGQTFEISGHTDSTGQPEWNLELSRKRAEEVKAHLSENYSIKPDSLSIAFFGDTRPAAPNTTTENRALNRRVEFKKLNQ
ncbi:MAG: OmpA family protein [Deltaproteobacteria bacterium]|jgi:outer membrane protein OmpA-like peptidoglycan-associated protein|nr:OmpA family protein [Deltaproteobacteria bacterium]